ncbi:MAG: phage/plasmid primase, P4 family [Candidatus Thiodiazotropha taylori]
MSEMAAPPGETGGHNLESPVAGQIEDSTRGVDLEEAKRHLTLLDEDAETLTFQTFDDNADRKDPTLTKVLTGQFDDIAHELIRLSDKGAGVFVTVNETDGLGRKAENITRIRALWQECDRGDEPPLPCEPHFVVESSPRKHHRYILTDTSIVNECKPVQQRLVLDYGSDPAAADISRVLRLAGFPHQKVSAKKGLTGEPHIVRIIEESGQQPYSWDEIKTIFPPVVNEPPSTTAKSHSTDLDDPDKIAAALSAIDPDIGYEDWLRVGMGLHSTNAGDAALDLWEEWSAKGSLFRPGECAYRWKTFSSPDPDTRPWENIGIASLYYIATQQGWDGKVPPHSYEKLEAFVEELDKNSPDILAAVELLAKRIGRSDITKLRKDYLFKQIKKKTGTNITSLREQAKEGGQSEPSDPSLADEVIDDIGKKNLLFCQTSFWLWSPYTEGVWQRVDDHHIRKSIHAVCADKLNNDYTKTKIDSIQDLIKTRSYKADHAFDQCTQIINCRNGQLEFIEDQWILQPHCREDYRTTQLPVEYDAGATAERFLQFLQEIFNGDADADQKTQMVLEIIGYTLLSTCRYEKFVLLIGTGANGKSVLLGVIEALLGHQNVCAVQPSQFDNRFQRAHLQNKLANIVTEIAEGAEIADAQLKAIVSGELTTAEHKHKPPFDFHPYATCWFGTNHMPHTRDFSDALFRRAIVLEFPNKFEDDRCDPHLKDKLVMELPGILNLSLDAIARVLETGQFTTCAGNEQAKRNWRLEADQVQQYVEECCSTGPGLKTPTGELYSSYKTWADSAGIKRTLNKNNFVNRLKRLGFESKRGTGGTRMVAGISPKDILPPIPSWSGGY